MPWDIPVTFKCAEEHNFQVLPIKAYWAGPGNYILENYNILVETRFTTSKTKLDILYSKLGTRVASRVAKRLKT